MTMTPSPKKLNCCKTFFGDKVLLHKLIQLNYPMECHKTEKCYNYYCGQDKNCVNMQIQHKNGQKRLSQTMNRCFKAARGWQECL